MRRFEGRTGAWLVTVAVVAGTAVGWSLAFVGHGAAPSIKKQATPGARSLTNPSVGSTVPKVGLLPFTPKAAPTTLLVDRGAGAEQLQAVDLATGQVLRTVIPEGGQFDVYISPDRRTVWRAVQGGNSPWQTWDVATGDPVPDNLPTAFEVAPSPNDRWMAEVLDSTASPPSPLSPRTVVLHDESTGHDITVGSDSLAIDLTWRSDSAAFGFIPDRSGSSAEVEWVDNSGVVGATSVPAASGCVIHAIAFGPDGRLWTAQQCTTGSMLVGVVPADPSIPHESIPVPSNDFLASLDVDPASGTIAFTEGGTAYVVHNNQAEPLITDTYGVLWPAAG